MRANTYTTWPVDKSNPRKRREPEEPGVMKILPMDFHVGARLTDEAPSGRLSAAPLRDERR